MLLVVEFQAVYRCFYTTGYLFLCALEQLIVCRLWY